MAKALELLASLERASKIGLLGGNGWATVRLPRRAIMSRGGRVTDIAGTYTHIPHFLIILFGGTRHLDYRPKLLQPRLYLLALFYLFCYLGLLLKYRQLQCLFILLRLQLRLSFSVLLYLESEAITFEFARGPFHFGLDELLLVVLLFKNDLT